MSVVFKLDFLQNYKKNQTLRGVVFVAGVVGEDFVAQAGAVDVDVDFGGGDALVAQHLLDGAQVGSALEQVGGEIK